MSIRTNCPNEANIERILLQTPKGATVFWGKFKKKSEIRMCWGDGLMQKGIVMLQFFAKEI